MQRGQVVPVDLSLALDANFEGLDGVRYFGKT